MMCNRSSVARKPGFGARRKSWRHHGESGDFFGLEVENMSPRAQIAAALSVLIPVELGAVLVLTLIPQDF